MKATKNSENGLKVPTSSSSPSTLKRKFHIQTIFINPVEYHGPHLPLSTDFDISTGLLSLFKKKCEQSLSTSFDLHFNEEPLFIHKGCAPAHGPGSESISLTDLSAEIIRVCNDLISNKSPVDCVLFMTAHGAPAHAFAIEEAIQFLKQKNIIAYNPFNIILTKMRDYHPSLVQSFSHHIEDSEYRKYWEQYLPEDFHGGTIETALMLFFNPEKVKPIYKTLPNYKSPSFSIFWKAPLFPLSFYRIFDKGAFLREWKIATFTYHWEKNPDYAGYTGGPKHANAELGKALAETFIELYWEPFLNIIENKTQSPKPIFKWVIQSEKWFRKIIG